ncbi:plasmid pRiA4b ORF-3 family protein [Actinokineospora sp.]|uniref:plasmid pRiA4b ORF-3 family protein n=1 Tax=Actinokineospora sp. TaxID=1872133 RepID=UPI0040380E73
MGDARRGQGTASAARVHTIKVTLRGVRPPIWRRLEVASNSTLEQVHHIIQRAFGWESYHMWVFDTPQGEFGVEDQELGHRSAASKSLRSSAPRVGSHLRYTYDFGDDWEHDILVEHVGAAASDTAYPRCLTGRRACPPEDCGGVWGYQILVEILADPDHEEHDERLEWLSLASADDFDPAAFDAAEVNAELSDLAVTLVET